MSQKKPTKLQRASTAQNMKFSIKDFFFKCDQIRQSLFFNKVAGLPVTVLKKRLWRIWSHLMKKSLMENFIAYAVLEWMKKILDEPNISYTNPEKNDHIYLEKSNMTKFYLQKHYLLWICDLHEIANEREITGNIYRKEAFSLVI